MLFFRFRLNSSASKACLLYRLLNFEGFLQGLDGLRSFFFGLCLHKSEEVVLLVLEMKNNIQKRSLAGCLPLLYPSYKTFAPLIFKKNF